MVIQQLSGVNDNMPLNLKQVQSLLRKNLGKGKIAVIDLDVDEKDVSANMTVGKCNRAITFSGESVTKKFPIGRKLNPGRGKKKGSTAENDVAKLLSKWYGQEGAFRRSAGSGSRFTRFNRDQRETPGDLIVPECLPWVIEIKCDETFDFERWLFTGNKNSLIETAWNQCLESTEEGRVPVLIARKNHSPWYIFFDSRMEEYLFKCNVCVLMFELFENYMMSVNSNRKNGQMKCIELSEFLSKVDVNKLKGNK